MKGEFTRMTRQRGRRYSGVRLQQGRVQLDADFNEQVDIAAHRDRVTTLDVIGPTGVPDSGGGFTVGARVALAAIDASGSSAVAVGQLATILASSDGGASWTAQPAPGTMTGDLLAVDLVAPGRAFAVGTGPAILTRDATTWTAQTLPPATSGTLRGVSFADVQRGFAVGEDGLILATTNGGAAWVRQTVTSATETLHAVHFIDAQRGWAVGEEGRILATTNGGTNWQPQQPPAGLRPALRSVRFANATHGFAVGDGGTILTSSDGGATWTLRQAPLGVTATLRSVDVESATQIWAVGDGPILLRSGDGGASWDSVAGPPDAADLGAIRSAGGLLVAGELSTIGRAASGTTPSWQAVNRPAAARDLSISPGRIYIDGILCEAENPTRYFAQPNLPEPPTPSAAGRYVVYLDVWERHLTALERPELREVALGGPDTATRTQTVWQLRLDGPLTAADCNALPANWKPSTPLGSGRMRARGAPAPLAADDCMVAAEGGYRRLENQLYRVEVVKAGAPGTAQVAWSRDNAAMVSRLDRIDAGTTNTRTRLVASDPGRDEIIGFAGARFVEVSDERRPLHREPGVLFEVDSVLENTITIKHAAGAAPSRSQFGAEPTLRRWDGQETLPAGGWTPLEDGVEVEFSAGSYAVGDFWTFPARTHTAAVEWPRVGGVPTFQPREGVEHAYAPLALVDRDATGNWTVAGDCRPLFTPLTGHTRISMAGGDGQELPFGTLDGKLLYPLEAAVMNGRRPVAGAVVRFEIEDGGGTVAALGAAAGTGSIDVFSNGSGISACQWYLAPAATRHRVRARLLDRAGQPLDAPLHFNARVAAAPGGGACTIDLHPGQDIQEALDKIRELGGGELCLAAGTYEIDGPLVVRGVERLTITGRGAATVLRGSGAAVLRAERCSRLTLRMLRIEARGASRDSRETTLMLFGCEQVKLLDCELSCPDRQELEQGCISSSGTRTDLLVERCGLETGAGTTGIHLESPTRVRIVATDIVVRAAPEGLEREMVRRAIELVPVLLMATIRAELAPGTRRIRLGRGAGAIELIDDERTNRTWRALERSVRVEGESFAAAEAIESYRNLLERDLDADSLFGRRSDEELRATEPDEREAMARRERERAVMELARAVRSAERGIRVVGSGVSLLEILRNTIVGASVGIELAVARGDRAEARMVVNGNFIRCDAIEGAGEIPCAVLAITPSSLTVTDTRAELAGTWAVDPETARRHKGVAAIVIDGEFGPFLIIRHSDLEGFPVGVRLDPANNPGEGGGDQLDQLWLVAETMATRGFRAVEVGPGVTLANNVHSF